jgi:para-nitrobenzyl esterase
LCTLADAERAGAIAGDDLGAMRALPAVDLMPLNAKINPAVRGLTVGRPLRPIVDGWSIPRDEVDAFLAGDFTPVPAIVGTNADEGGFFGSAIPVQTPEGLRDYLERNFGPAAPEAWTVYGADTCAAALTAACDAFGDAQFSYGARSLARVLAARERRTFRYVFTHAGTHTANPPAHTDEIAYVFGNGDFDVGDRAVSDAMLAAWVNFAAGGDPNGLGAPPWAPYDPARDNDLRFGGSFAAGTGWRTGPLDFIERFYRASRA